MRSGRRRPKQAHGQVSVSFVSGIASPRRGDSKRGAIAHERKQESCVVKSSIKLVALTVFASLIAAPLPGTGLVY